MSINIIFSDTTANGPASFDGLTRAIHTTTAIVAEAAGIEGDIRITDIDYRDDWSDLEDQNHVYTFVGTSQDGHHFDGSVNMTFTERKGWFCFDSLLNEPDRAEFFQPMIDQFKGRG